MRRTPVTLPLMKARANFQSLTCVVPLFRVPGRTKYRQYTPENRTDEEIRELIEENNGEEAAIQRVISTWWEQALAAEGGVAAVETAKSGRAVAMPPPPSSLTALIR